MDISNKTYRIAQSSGVSILLAFTGWAVHAPTWLSIAAYAAIAGGTVTAVRHVINRSEMFVDLSLDHRISITRWISVAAVAHLAWFAGVAIRPDLVLWWAGAILGVALVEHSVARGLEYLMTRPVHADVVAAQAGRAQERDQDEVDAAVLGLRKVLEQAGLYWVIVAGNPVPIRAGYQWPVRIPSKGALTAKSQIRDLSPADGEEIAKAFNDLTGSELQADWVQIEKGQVAGRYLISVVTEDVTKTVIPYTEEWDDQGRAYRCDLSEPMINGYKINGDPVFLNIAQHGQVVGKSGSGKSDGLKRKIAHALRGGAEVWLAGTRKLYDLAGEILQPYAGTGRTPCIGAVAYGQDDLLAMYAAALRLSLYRQNTLVGNRKPWRPIVIVTDECSFALEDSSTKIPYDGHRRNAAQLATEGVKATRSSLIYWWFSGQRGTNDQLGEEGGTLKTNIGFTEVYRSKDPAELGRCLGDEYYKLTKPRHPGQSWLDQGDGLPEELTSDMPVFAKGPYIQEADASKRKLHSGMTAGDIFWARRDLVDPDPFTPGELAELGEWYASRPKTADEMIAYLTGKKPVPQLTAENDAYEAQWAELEALGIPRPRAIEAPAPPVDALIVNPGPAPVPPSPVTRKDRIVHLITETGEMSAGDIIAAMAELEGKEAQVIRTSVQNTLSHLVRVDKRLVRPGGGTYRLP